MSDLENLQIILDCCNKFDGSFDGNQIIINNLSCGVSELEEALSRIEEIDQTTIELCQNNTFVALDRVTDILNLTVSIIPPRNSTNYVADDLNDLIRHQGFSKPLNFMLLKNKYISNATPLQEVSAYISLCNLFLVLIKSNVIENSSIPKSYSLVTTEGKINWLVDKEYDYINLFSRTHLEVTSAINRIVDLLDNQEYSVDKSNLLRAVLGNFTKSCDEASRTNHIIKHLPEVAEAFSHNCDLFYSKFSFEDKKESLLEDIRGFYTMLNSILTSIQAQLFAIPITFIVFISQIKYSSTGISQRIILSINCSILLAALVLLIIVLKILGSQKQVLKNINGEINEKESRLKRLVPQIHEAVKNNFTQLREYSEATSKNICIVKSCGIAMFIILFILCVCFTPTSKNWIKNKLISSHNNTSANIKTNSVHNAIKMNVTQQPDCQKKLNH